MVFDAASLFYGFMLILLSDLGDKTWGLVVAFAIWCPWCGLREGGAALMSTTYLLIIMGCTGVLALRCFLLAVGVDPFKWDCGSEFIAAALLLVFALRATLDWRCAVQGSVRREAQPLQPAMAAKPAPQPPLQDDPEAAEPSGYGSVAKPSGSVVWKEPAEGWTQALATALLLPMVSVLFAEAGDSSQGALVIGDWQRADVTVGAVFGFLASCLGALVFGHQLRWRVSEGWLFFIVSAILWAVCLCSVRDAMLHLVLGTLLPMGPEVSRVALAGVTT